VTHQLEQSRDPGLFRPRGGALSPGSWGGIAMHFAGYVALSSPRRKPFCASPGLNGAGRTVLAYTSRGAAISRSIAGAGTARRRVGVDVGEAHGIGSAGPCLMVFISICERALLTPGRAARRLV
jgi:hypothetical protein